MKKMLCIIKNQNFSVAEMVNGEWRGSPVEQPWPLIRGEHRGQEDKLFLVSIPSPDGGPRTV